MKKLFQNIILILIMLFSFTINVNADTLPVASDGKIVLDKDYTIDDITFSNAAEVSSLDLNGKTLTLNGTINIKTKFEIKNGVIKRNTSNSDASLIEITSGTNGVVSFKNVIVDGQKVIKNIATSNGVGHGIVIRKDSNVVLDKVTLRNHWTDTKVGTGAIFTQQANNVLIKNSEIYGNRSNANAGVALYADGGENLELINTKIYNNYTAISGVVNIQNVSNFIFDKDSIIKNNQASAAGGIRLLNTAGTISGTIEGNESFGDNGGGLYTIFDNDLYKDRVINVTSSAKIIDNISALAGGGLYVNSGKTNTPGTVIVDGATFSGNKAMGTTDESAGLLKGVGGGAIAVSRGILEITSANIYNNIASFNRGNSIIVSHANGNINGGKLTINGGTYDDSIDLGVGSIVINGGIFKNDIREYITDKKLTTTKTEDGYKVVKKQVTVEKIKLISKSEDLNNNNDDDLNVIFDDLGQFAIYEVTLMNNTSKTLFVNDLEDANISEEFIHCILDEESIGSEIKPGKTTTVKLIVKTLEVEGAGRNLNDEISLKLNFLISEEVINPETINNILELIISVILIFSLIFVCLYKGNIKTKIMSLVIATLLIGSISVFASDVINIGIDGVIGYKSQNLMEESGNKVNDYSVDYSEAKDIWKYYNKIKTITISSISSFDIEYEKEFDITIGDKNRVKAYLVKNDENLYDLYITSRGVIYAPSNATALFSFPKVEKIIGLENLIFKETKNMTGMFMGNENMKEVNVESIDFSNVEDTSYMFSKCYDYEVAEEKLNIPDTATSNDMFVKYLYDEIKKNTNSDKNTDFSQTPIAGKYYADETKDNENPIYYYRGAVTDNNALFANFCWKIVRTTETGGVKLIYNGLPSATGSCNNTGEASQIGKSSYNYSDITNGFDYETSVIKNTIDNWYKKNMTTYTNYLEDTVWCNEREISGEVQEMTYFTSRARVALVSFNPTTQCKREEDSLTVNSKKLTYPVGLLTADELTYTGTGWAGYSTSSFLNTGVYWWTMSPYRYDNKVASGKYNVFLANVRTGNLYYAKIHNQLGVRPAVSLKAGTDYVSGDGTVNNPYIIK